MLQFRKNKKQDLIPQYVEAHTRDAIRSRKGHLKRNKRSFLNLLPVSLLFGSAVFTMVNFSRGMLKNKGLEVSRSMITKNYHGMEKWLEEENDNEKATHVSIIVSIEKNYNGLEQLLSSILAQKSKARQFELILVDKWCVSQSHDLIDTAFSEADRESAVPLKLKYLPICDKSGFSSGSNEGAKLVDQSSKWILFLEHSLVLEGENFISDMADLAESRDTVGAVGCKVLAYDGKELIHAGRVLWDDGSFESVGLGSRDINAPEFSYVRPVDNVSGSCLLVEKEIFNNYGGFDSDNFPNYNEDADLQMHIQHDQGKEVWFQPLAVARNHKPDDESFENGAELKRKAINVFKTKWKSALEKYHPKHPIYAQDVTFAKHSDLRSRNPTRANILYFDLYIPNKSQGGGFGRAFDNISMMTALGHRVTIAQYHPYSEDWCDKDCVKKLTDLGAEVVLSDWEKFYQSRIGFFDIVMISRPSTLTISFERWREFYEKYPFSLVYDCEALWHRRDYGLRSLSDSGFKLPGASDGTLDLKQPSLDLFMNTQRHNELSLLKMADTIVPVSDGEAKIIAQLIPTTEKKIHTIGHIMDTEQMTQSTFRERNGILFLASFGDKMYYNGDAIWYFLKYTYPLILQESSTSIPLTIAGRNIPKDLYEMVESNPDLTSSITFMESPVDIKPLYEKTRVFIAPHLYGAGIQYKVSEALSIGIPTALSGIAAEGFGLNAEDNIACIGRNPDSFKKCILDMHNNEEIWTQYRSNGLDFIRETHSYERTMQEWSNIIDSSLDAINASRANSVAKHKCRSGEEGYLQRYADIAEAINEKHHFHSGFLHWKRYGKAEGRFYVCLSEEQTQHGLLTTDLIIPTKKCREGEENYLSKYSDVAVAIKEGFFESGFQHYDHSGKFEGRTYICLDDYFQQQSTLALDEPNTKAE